jgi:hypothetical protein
MCRIFPSCPAECRKQKRLGASLAVNLHLLHRSDESAFRPSRQIPARFHSQKNYSGRKRISGRITEIILTEPTGHVCRIFLYPERQPITHQPFKNARSGNSDGVRKN